MNINELIGQKIRKHRKAKGMTQKELAKQLDVAHNTISSYESGTNEINASVLFSISLILGIEIQNFFPKNQTMNF